MRIHTVPVVWTDGHITVWPNIFSWMPGYQILLPKVFCKDFKSIQRALQSLCYDKKHNEIMSSN